MRGPGGAYGRYSTGRSTLSCVCASRYQRVFKTNLKTALVTLRLQKDIVDLSVLAAIDLIYVVFVPMFMLCGVRSQAAMVPYGTSLHLKEARP